jgi:hypothetical protein
MIAPASFLLRFVENSRHGSSIIVTASSHLGKLLGDLFIDELMRMRRSDLAELNLALM